ncbi:cellulose biosynthesis protein BcsR [Zestomonas carbonaria]|uniref:Cellulose biosynthesis protein BcsR n=1 Tax=Zestomonas carbonaria TaxID=2762745 RepID=A0A7U7ESU8_9GAMM|nr:cellulose biosynthesis protein BcsR [Pseudomonas carbonaria]CAD5109610.1 hypothetical protein PSEWESI4_03916 [Pseudomonas carbonaria]
MAVHLPEAKPNAYNKSRDDIARLLLRYQMPAFQYVEIQKLQDVATAVAEWPLLQETLLPLVELLESRSLGQDE